MRPPSQAAISRAIPVPSGLVPLCVQDAGAWVASALKGGYLGARGPEFVGSLNFQNDRGEREC